MHPQIIKVFYFLFILGFNCIASSQTKIKGIIKSQNSNEVLPYVNIGIINKKVGTVTNDKGQFELNILKRHHLDSLKLSMIGYVSRTFLVKDFIAKTSSFYTIYLEENIEELDEVVLTNKMLKEKIIGNKTKSKNIYGAFNYNRLGNEMGIKVKIRKSPTYIDSLYLNIIENDNPKFKFRINFYSIKDKVPYKNLLSKNIIVDNNIHKGLLAINLTPHNIVVNDDIIVTIEWLENLGEGSLKFSAGILNGRTYMRYTSQSNWDIIGPGSIGIHLKVRH